MSVTSVDITSAPWNAKGDGVTDDTAAIQAAANFVGYGGILIFPKGTFLHTATIQLHGATKILGQGVDRSVIYRTGDYGDTYVCGTAADQSEPARSCEFRNLHFAHSTPYIANSTTLANKATRGAHLRLYGAQEAVISNCWFSRLPAQVVCEGGSWVKIIQCQFSGVYDKLQPALQEGIVQLHAKWSAVHGNPTTWIVQGCNFLGATFQRDITYQSSTGSKVVNRIDTIGSQFGFLIDGLEDLDCSANYFGGQSAAELAFINAPSGGIIDIRVKSCFFDGIAQGPAVLFAPEAPNTSALAVVLEGNVHTDNLHAVFVNRNVGSGTPSVYDLTIADVVCLSGIGTQFRLGGAKGFSVTGGNIADYNKHDISPSDATYTNAILPYDLSEKGLINGVTVGGGGNNLQNSPGVNFCYGGIGQQPGVQVKNTNVIGVRDGSNFRVGFVASQNQKILTAPGNYPSTADDTFVGVNKSVDEATVVVLPPYPPVGFETVVKDLRGNASAYQIIVATSDGSLIDGAPTRNIATNHGSFRLRFVGLGWAII